MIALGCGGRPPAPPPPPPGAGVIATPEAAPSVPRGPLDRDLDRLAERSVALFSDVKRAFDTAGDNCAAAATKLDEVTRSYADVITANAKVLSEGREMQLKIALRRFDDQFNKAALAIMQSKTIAVCFENAPFAKAFEGLAGPKP